MKTMMTAALLASVICGRAFGQNDENDVLCANVIADAAALGTGNIDAISGALRMPVRVVRETVNVVPGFDELYGDEGFFAVSDAGVLPAGYTVMSATVDLRFDFLAFSHDGETSNLWFWDTVASPAVVDFVPVVDGRSLAMRKSPIFAFNARVAGEAVGVPGFVIDRTGTTGSLHRHLTLVLDDADSDPGTPVQPGVYLYSYALSADRRTSPAVYTVLGADLGVDGDSLLDAAEGEAEGWLNPPDCPGDLDGDRMIDLSDLGVVLAAFGVSGAGDLDGDGDTDLSDLGVVLAAYGTACP